MCFVFHPSATHTKLSQAEHPLSNDLKPKSSILGECLRMMLAPEVLSV